MTTDNRSTETVCACPSIDARRCFQIRYPRADDEYESDDFCECCCHEQEQPDYFEEIGDPFK